MRSVSVVALVVVVLLAAFAYVLRDPGTAGAPTGGSSHAAPGDSSGFEAPASADRIDLGRSRSTEVVREDVEETSEPVALRGRVVDEVDRRPLEGVEVVAEVSGGYYRPRRRLGKALTGPDGHFALRDLDAPLSRVILTALKRGYVMAEQVPSTQTAVSRFREIALVRGIEVTGEVVFADGTPVGGGQGLQHADPQAQPGSTPGQGFPEALYDSTGRLGFALDERGRFRSCTTASRIAFEVFGDEFAPAFSEILEPKGGAANHVVIRVDRGQVVRGTVHDPDARPVAGATVAVLPAIQDRYPDHLFFVHSARLTATTGADGWFEVRGAPEQYRSLLVFHPDFLDSREYNLLADSGREVAVMLQPAAWIEGSLERPPGHGAGPLEARLLQGRKSVEVDVGAGGRLRSAVLAGEISRGTLFVRGFVPVELSWPAGPGSKDVGVVSLRQGLGVQVSAVDDTGKALESCLVEVRAGARDDDRPPWVDRVETDREGKAVAHGVASECLQVAVSRDGYEPWQDQAEVELDSEELAFHAVLVRDASLEGRVVDVAGSPVPDARVRVYANPNEVGRGRRWSADSRSDDDGRFRVRAVAAQCPLSVWVTAPGFPDVQQDLAGVEPGDTGDAGTVTLPSGRAITGTVRDETGHPLAGALVWASLVERGLIMLTGNGEIPWDETDAFGEFRIPGLEPGEYRVSGSCRAAKSEVTTVDLEAEEEAKIDLTLAGEDGRLFTGRVVDDHGSPVGMAHVGVYSEDRHGCLGTSRGDGTFSIHAVPEGVPLRVIVHHEDFLELTLECTSAAELPQELRLSRGAGVDVRVTVLGDRLPPAHVRVHLHGQRASGQRFSSSFSRALEHGVLHLSGLAEGTTDVQLEATDFPLSSVASVELREGITAYAAVTLDGVSSAVAIKVLGAEGQPIANASISFRSSGRGTVFLGHGSTDERGLVHSYIARSEGVDLEVQAPGYHPARVADAASWIVDDEIVVQLEPEQG